MLPEGAGALLSPTHIKEAARRTGKRFAGSPGER